MRAPPLQLHGRALRYLSMKRSGSIFAAVLGAVVLTATASAQWRPMDYRAPGFVWTDTNSPTTNTDYTAIWRYIRQARGEAAGWAAAEHNLDGTHAADSIRSDYLPNSIFGTNYIPALAFYDLAPVGTNPLASATFPTGTNWTTNVVVAWISGHDRNVTVDTTGTTITDASGGDGPFSTLGIGEIFRLGGPVGGWTGYVATVAEDGTWFTPTAATPDNFWTSETTLTLATGVSTNILNQPTWSMGAVPLPEWESLTVETQVQHRPSTQGKILIGMNGLTLWWQVHTYVMPGYIQNTSYPPGQGAGFSWPPFIVWPWDGQVWGDYYDPPLTTIYAMMVKPLSDAAAGSTEVNNTPWWPTNSTQCLTWPCAGTPYGPMQFFGQPLQNWWAGSLAGRAVFSGTGSYLVIVIGK